MTAPVIAANNLRKKYGKGVTALDGVSFTVGAGRIVGLMGPNGAGKTTALKAILGLTPFEGELAVLGRDPRRDRDALMQDVCFIADVAVLPKWLRVEHALDYVGGVHPRFDRTRAEAVLRRVAEAPGSVALFSHGHFSRLVIAAWLQLPPSRGRSFAIRAGSVTVLGHEHGNPVIWAAGDVPGTPGVGR